MSTRINTIFYKGEKILYFDYSKMLKEDEIIEMIHQTYQKVEECYQNHEKVLTLTNFADAYASSKILEVLNGYAKTHGYKIDRMTGIGLVGLKKMFARAFNAISKSELKYFDKKEDALEYLIQDNTK